jgi:hypothetical protein
VLTLRSPFAYFRASTRACNPAKKVFSLKKLAKTCCFFSFFSYLVVLSGESNKKGTP